MNTFTSRCLCTFIALCIWGGVASAQVVEIPDPNLESAIREALQPPARQPITEQNMAQLEVLNAKSSHIVDITGLEYATNLRWLSIHKNEVQDITPLATLINLKTLILADNPIANLGPLANLTSLEHLSLPGVVITDLTPLFNLTQLKELYLAHCQISDITPLANLTQLITLDLSWNQIVDVSPLANLTALESLWINRNWIVDFRPILGLSLTELQYDEPCVLPNLPIHDRLENRSLPSIVQGWDNTILNLPALSYEELTAYHDLYWGILPFGLRFRLTLDGYQVTGDIERAIAERDELVAKNPNMLFLAEIRQRDAHSPSQYREDWFGWLRDDAGNRVRNYDHSDVYLIDFRRPEVQDIIVEQAISVSKCGLYDGIFFDWWQENGGTLTTYGTNPRVSYSTPEEERQARLTILKRIRDRVPNDFLILCNSGRRKLPLSAPYINGNFMETFYREEYYTHDDIIEIETNLIWLEANLREPQINCLRGKGIPTEPPDSPNNRRWMRVFTTMSLTLSDGYALYVTGIYEQYQSHIWYPFWDADLGQPVSPTTQPYQDIEGLYIREFTNGWAVYNRSGQAQTITLPSSASSVSDRGNNAASLTHLLPDLDGEIYIATRSFADVNGDGRVNVLDLVQVANGFGKSTPDLNDDGAVNILDLVFVSQQFSQ